MGMKDLKNRYPLTTTVSKQTNDFLNGRNAKTSIPKGRIVDDAIELLIKKLNKEDE